MTAPSSSARPGGAAALRPISTAGPAGRLAGWIADPSDDGHVPDGAPILFIHPINTRGKIWEDIAALLSAHHVCVMPDMRGHGESDITGEFGLDEWLSDCVAVLDAHGTSEPVHVIGGSLGGSLACCFAAKYPERTVSISSMGGSLNFDGVDVDGVIPMFEEFGVQGTFRKVFPTMTFGPYCTPELIERGIALANPNDVATVSRVWTATITSDSTDLARTVTCPALVITGEFDATCTPALGLEMARALRTEQIVMPDIGHMPMLEAPEWTARLISRHLDAAEQART